MYEAGGAVKRVLNVLYVSICYFCLPLCCALRIVEICGLWTQYAGVCASLFCSDCGYVRKNVRLRLVVVSVALVRGWPGMSVADYAYGICRSWCWCW